MKNGNLLVIKDNVTNSVVSTLVPRCCAVGENNLLISVATLASMMIETSIQDPEGMPDVDVEWVFVQTEMMEGCKYVLLKQ